MKYLLDANVFIQAKNREYGFDFCPAFWRWIELQHAAGLVHSIERVGQELLGAGDELTTWTAERGPGFFLPPTPEVATAFGALSSWVLGAGYQPSAQHEFLGSTDYFLVAHAVAHGLTVVTHEVPAPLARRKVKIPDACLALHVSWMAPHQMLRIERARFELVQAPSPPA